MVLVASCCDAEPLWRLFAWQTFQVHAEVKILISLLSQITFGIIVEQHRQRLVHEASLEVARHQQNVPMVQEEGRPHSHLGSLGFPFLPRRYPFGNPMVPFESDAEELAAAKRPRQHWMLG